MWHFYVRRPELMYQRTITVISNVFPAAASKDRSQRCLVAGYNYIDVYISLDGCLDINRVAPLCITKLTPAGSRINVEEGVSLSSPHRGKFKYFKATNVLYRNFDFDYEDLFLRF
ncbi:uncharacterized protein LOC112212292 [Bombus impatiens]|uniref:Uncharacterized protein LOC112212292 n=1 Tax=Bombus impatiens TaxID=132113 RepID=A0A6P8LAC5_BOMIM|nr:uncharacterized protein LOC112212292 [Bombus impatiens]